jgi:hypothetical protein
MARLSSLRALAAILLTAGLVASWSPRLRAGEIRSAKTAAQEACKELGAGWCRHSSGERAPHLSVQTPTPDVVFAAQSFHAALPTPDPARVRPRPSRLPRQR